MITLANFWVSFCTSIDEKPETSHLFDMYKCIQTHSRHDQKVLYSGKMPFMTSLLHDY